MWVVRIGAWKFSFIAAHVLRLRRKVALDNLKRAFPEKENRELRRIYARCWRHFIRVGAELARIPRLNIANVARWIDLSQHKVLKDALSGGKGVIAVSGHFGNWEWMGAGVTIIGYPVAFVVTSQTNRLVEDWMNRMRQSVDIETVHRSRAVRGFLSARKRNRIVAILCDQDAGTSGVFVNFFGRPASTPRGPAAFHLKTGMPIVFVSAPRGRDGKYHLTFEKMKFSKLTGNREQDVQVIMQEITTRLEAEIRACPEQWLWLHRRWKTEEG